MNWIIGSIVMMWGTMVICVLIIIAGRVVHKLIRIIISGTNKEIESEEIEAP